MSAAAFTMGATVTRTENRCMCRNIRPLFNFEPPASEDEIRASAIQFVRKVSGFSKPSEVNRIAFDQWGTRRIQTTFH